MVPRRGSCWSRPSSTAAQGGRHQHSKTAAPTGDPQRPKSNYDTYASNGIIKYRGKFAKASGIIFSSGEGATKTFGMARIKFLN
jgi:hypothetical protein